MKNVFILVVAIALMGSCGMKKEAETLMAKADSLQRELDATQVALVQFNQVMALIDSIDSKRNALKTDLESGTTYESYSAKMKDIYDYVESTQKKLTSLESTLSKSESTRKNLYAQVQNLKKDLETKNNEIAELQKLVENYKEENKNLNDLVAMQEADLKDKAAQIDAKRQELTYLEQRITEIMRQAKVSEADNYYARGEAVLDAANRTQLAPKKKKESLKEALSLFEKAKELGHTGAQAKIDLINTKLK